METGRRATIVDIATAVGVSRQTVTRAMNDMPGINEVTKQRVLDAARELGYRPSRFGRGLVKRDQQTIGLMVHNLTNPYYPELAAAVVAHAAERGWSVMLLDLSKIDDQRAYLTTLAPQVDALVGFVSIPHRELSLILPGVPVVEIAGPSDDLPEGWGGVEFDLEPGVREAVDHLLASGASRPVVLDSPGALPASPRALLMVAAWQAHGITPTVIAASQDGVVAGEEATREHIDEIRGADAVMAFNDFCAFGAMKELRRQGLRVPDDIRVIGLDGLSAGTYTMPELTTMGVDMDEAAMAAVAVARSMLDGTPGPRRVRLSHRLILRESA
ncbi:MULTISPECIES: LacI family DNA-binding transcriptional regulator [unclassified Microbacterium]|uniref:LacI family DNA-binding transcriptional regulator n=1 Tax=unclassified Microbacterium TaxID=2609290 RepID=UPI0012F8AB36|nr:LacI family DNA-binding transcriptional regulator [Microbacterium sp. MAH-37]MVQ43839.1 LacI family DNA-binding transcriptional regulator [Microbacterium sp. MAH-37]